MLSQDGLTITQLIEIATRFFGPAVAKDRPHIFVPPWVHESVFSIKETDDGFAKPYQVRLLKMHLRRLQIMGDSR